VPDPCQGRLIGYTARSKAADLSANRLSFTPLAPLVHRSESDANHARDRVLGPDRVWRGASCVATCSARLIHEYDLVA
jgi:hypothetical protein